MDNPTTKKDIDNLRENYRAKVFRMMLHIALIFAIPAGLAVWLGNMLDQKYSTDGNTWHLVLLAIAFVSSWIIVARLYIKLNKEAKDIEAKAREVKERESITMEELEK